MWDPKDSSSKVRDCTYYPPTKAISALIGVRPEMAADDGCNFHPWAEEWGAEWLRRNAYVPPADPDAPPAPTP